MKILSIVIPTYNMEKYLDRCLISLILPDAYMDMLEVLVINDGSKDRSSEIAHGYELRYPGTFKVVDKENGNYGSCVNKGLELATGKYFKILDSDDWFATENMPAFLEHLSNTEAELVFTKRLIHNADSDVESHFPECLLPEKMVTVAEFNALEDKPYLNMHCMTFRMDILRKCGLELQTGISYTDTEYCYYPLKFVNTISFYGTLIYHYDMARPGQTMSLDKLVHCIGDMAKVLTRILDDRKQSDAACEQKKIQTHYLKEVLKVFYSIALTMCRKSKENDAIVRSVDERLMGDKDLLTYTGALTVNTIHYVSLWRKFGVYNSDGCFRVYNSLYGKVKGEGVK